MKIALDITSGDLAPKSTINGAKKYLKNNTTSKLILIGRKSYYKSIIMYFNDLLIYKGN